MIVKNAGAYIRDLAESVQGVFTQYVFVDTGSTDGTKELLAEFGYEVFEHPFVDFADARNVALGFMRTKWVMFLDADDVLPLASSLLCLRAVLGAPKNVGGFQIPVQFPLEKGNTRVDHLKIVRREIPGLKWDYEIHEQILPSVTAQGFRTAPVPGAFVLHLNYDTTPEGQEVKRRRDRPLLERMVANRPECPFSAWCMGMTLEAYGELEEALTWFDRVQSFSIQPSEVLRKALLLKASALFRLGRDSEARETALEALRKFPGDGELNYLLAEKAFDSGRFEDALSRLDAMRSDVDSGFKSVDASVFAGRRNVLRARVQIGLGNYAEGAEALGRIMNGPPAEGSREACIALFDEAMSRADFPTAEAALRRRVRYGGRSDEWCSARFELARRRGEDPREVFQRLVQAYPHEEGASRWLSTLDAESESTPVEPDTIQDSPWAPS